MCSAAGYRADGIIPAYAGSTTERLQRWSRRWDHPRVCGEHRSNTSRSPLMRGSSPRMRGAPLALDTGASLGRIIPAYAGSTSGYFGESGVP